MASSKERGEISVLRGHPNHRDASGSAASLAHIWSQPPTPIQLPSNDQRMQQTRSFNPYDRAGTSRKKGGNTTGNVGNQTASRTLLPNRTVDDISHPSKKRKVSSGGTFTISTTRQVMNAQARMSRQPLSPPPLYIEPYSDIIDVDDDEFEDIGQIVRRPLPRQSSDELNLRPREPSAEQRVSKYPFTKDVDSGSSKKVKLVPDGPSTAVMGQIFSEREDDPIEDFEEIPRPPINRVKQEVERIEGKAPPKVDFTKAVRKQQGKSAKEKMQPKIRALDTVATSTTPFVRGSQSTAKDEGYIPIRKFYLGKALYAGIPEQELKMFASHNGSLSIKDDDKVLFRGQLGGKYVLARADAKNLKVNSVIQFKPDSTDEKVITICLDTDGSDWNPKRYDKFLALLNKNEVRSEVIRGHTSALWETAEQDAAQQQAELPEKVDRLAELREVQDKKKDERDLGPAPSSTLPGKRKAETAPVACFGRGASLRYTPPAPDSDPESGLIKYREGTRKVLKPASSRGPKKITTPTAETAPGRRRSARNHETPPQRKQLSPAEAEMVILTYPQGRPGAVNVTQGDVARLEEGEFLNDTLIEFGLRLWLQELEKDDPDLASQIHVFNSFFYKKLNHKKDTQLGYESVRKWTAKIDLFQKKYVIVPINEHLHWYLAIIYQPEHVLLSTSMDTGSLMRPQTRLSTIQTTLPNDGASKLSGQTTRDPPINAEELEDGKSEGEVEWSLTFQSSCAVEDSDKRMESPPKEDRHSDIYLTPPPKSPLTELGDDADIVNPNAHTLSPSASDYGKNISVSRRSRSRSDSVARSGSVKAMEVDEIEDSSVVTQAKPARQNGVVEPASFYQPIERSHKSKGKQKAEPEQEMYEMDIEPDEVILVDEIPKTYIFTFDSLGGRHPQAVNKLSAYLKLEAKDKKGIDTAGLAVGKHALVPTQPNFCDCGIYLLHFAKTFMSNPKKFASIILAARKKGVPNQERTETWSKPVKMRQDLKELIGNMSTEWMKVKQETKEREVSEGRKYSDSDEDCEVVGETKPPTSPKRQRKAGGGLLASRMRG